MQLAVKENKDGTYTLTVDGTDYVEPDGETVLVRETVEEVVASATILFGGHADTIETPGAPPEPPPSPVDSQGNIVVENFDPNTESPTGPAPPVGDNPIPPSLADTGFVPASTTEEPPSTPSA